LVPLAADGNVRGESKEAASTADKLPLSDEIFAILTSRLKVVVRGS
jgi:hypothetical protein